MGLVHDKHVKELREAGWHSRGYLPHFDVENKPQFVTLHLSDALPQKVLAKWQAELMIEKFEDRKILLHKRIEKYLDCGYGACWLKDNPLANMCQESLLKYDSERYRLSAWVVMPNHVHTLLTPLPGNELKNIFQKFKSYTAHEGNRILQRSGQFWIWDYFDRYIRNDRHYRAVVRYIEYNPVKAGCADPGDWPYSSAYFRSRKH